jgi:hypothetical protein
METNGMVLYTTANKHAKYSINSEATMVAKMSPKTGVSNDGRKEGEIKKGLIKVPMS